MQRKRLSLDHKRLSAYAEAGDDWGGSEECASVCVPRDRIITVNLVVQYNNSFDAIRN
jgi:hypothetical protein